MEKKWYEETPIDACERVAREDDPVMTFIGVVAVLALVVKFICLLLR